MAGVDDDASGLNAENARLRDELDQARRAAEKVAQAVEQFASSLAHDLKNPLAAMRVNVQALKRSIENGKQLSAAHIVERLERLERAIDQSLELLASKRARLDGSIASSPSLQLEAMDLVPLVQAQVDALASDIGNGRIALDGRCRAAPGTWDRHRLGHVIRELLDNAMKFSPPDSVVRLTIRHDPLHQVAEVAVADAGIGIPEHDLAHVCERFYRADNVVGRYKGAGLGLFEVYRCAADHGGTLTVQSEEGRGTSVTLRLPLQPTP